MACYLGLFCINPRFSKRFQTLYEDGVRWPLLHVLLPGMFLSFLRIIHVDFIAYSSARAVFFLCF